MQKRLMEAAIREEMEHIPKGEKGSAQQDARLLYNMVRLRDLGRDEQTPRNVTLGYVVNRVVEMNPGAVIDYDRDFFDETCAGLEMVLP